MFLFVLFVLLVLSVNGIQSAAASIGGNDERYSGADSEGETSVTSGHVTNSR